MSPLPSLSTHFPYTTLFRSRRYRDIDRAGLDELGIRGLVDQRHDLVRAEPLREHRGGGEYPLRDAREAARDRKSTRLNSSHVRISYAVFCLKKKKQNKVSP